MAYDVFISHSSKDHDAVDKVASFLKEKSITCFTDDDNLPPGSIFAEVIATAISESSVFLLIFSSNSDPAPDVGREVGLAIKFNKPIIPFRLEKLEPDKLGFPLSGISWLDGFPPPLQKYLPMLLDAIRHYLLADNTAPPLNPVTNTKSPARPGPKPPVKGKIWERVNIDKHPDGPAIKKTCDAGKYFIGRNWIYRKNRYTGEYEKSLK